jgi:hypothetical protein
VKQVFYRQIPGTECRGPHERDVGSVKIKQLEKATESLENSTLPLNEGGEIWLFKDSDVNAFVDFD